MIIMKLNKILFVLSLILVSQNQFAQTLDAENALRSKYTQTELEDLKQNKPTEFEALKYEVNHAWYIAEFPVAKASDVKHRFDDVQLTSMENINYLELGYDLKSSDYQYFRINGGSKMLVLRSRDHTRKMMNKAGGNNEK